MNTRSGGGGEPSSWKKGQDEAGVLKIVMTQTTSGSRSLMMKKNQKMRGSFNKILMVICKPKRWGSRVMKNCIRGMRKK